MEQENHITRANKIQVVFTKSQGFCSGLLRLAFPFLGDYTMLLSPVISVLKKLSLLFIGRRD